MTDWDFVGRRHSGPVPIEVVAAITAALRAYLAGERQPAAAAPLIPWGLAGRREAVGFPAVATMADLDR